MSNNSDLALILALKAASGGGGGEPSQYLKSIAKNGNQISITSKGGTITTFELDKIPYGSTLPSGQYVGQVFIYTGTEIAKGAYYFDGNEWHLFANVSEGTSVNWDDVLNKPFSTIGTGLTVDGTALKINGEIIATIEYVDDTFVAKEEGKGLSTNDYTTAEKTKLASLENYDDTEIKEDISELQSGKVDKETGKGLSTNDYDNTEKGKVASALQPTDVVDDLISSDTDKPLSAKQGKELNDNKAPMYELLAHTSNRTNPHNVTKAQLGLGNVDNTSDLNKPISTAQAAVNEELEDDIENLESTKQVNLVFNSSTNTLSF